MIAVSRPTPKFQEGQLIHHLRYDYRGVVVAIDPCCRANDSWYESNRTQPDREQPWYHVLVDGSSTTTYVAESNLEPDETGEPIAHPLLEHFFKEFADGHYVRREDQPWPGWQP